MMPLTFDQPLYWKTLTSIQSQTVGRDLKRMLLRLRWFHTLMSFLGSIGHLMAGTGVLEHINIMFAGNVVRHYVDWQGHLQSSSWPHVDICCIEHQSCSEGIPHSVANQGDILAQTGPSNY